MKNEHRIIRASEIGEYNYCSRAWWYRHVVKLAPPIDSEQGDRFAKGQKAHAQHGRSVALSGTLRVVGIGLLALGLLLLIAVMIINMMK